MNELLLGMSNSSMGTLAYPIWADVYDRYLNEQIIRMGNIKEMRDEMSKHTLLLKNGERFEWDDDLGNNPEDWLVRLYSDIGKYHFLTTYIGEDPYKEWNDKIKKLQGEVIEWLEKEIGK